MNKGELIDIMAESGGIKKSVADDVLKSILSSIYKSLASGEDVRLVGFGTFSVGERASRTGRNPQTGASMQIPARKFVKFRPGKDFSAIVNDDK